MNLKKMELQYINDENDIPTHVILKNKDYHDLFYVVSEVVSLVKKEGESSLKIKLINILKSMGSVVEEEDDGEPFIEAYHKTITI